MIPIIREIRAGMHSDEAFSIYSACMYKPAREKYAALIAEYLSSPETRCFGAYESGTLTGVIVVRCGEILGIAVRTDMRGQGVGRMLIAHALTVFPGLTAETDEDSVGFYRSCGFACDPFARAFPDGSCVRYACRFTK